jgi:Secretion system C-terminal sorting domain
MNLMDIAVENTLLTGYAVFEACGMLGIHPVIERNIDLKTRSAEVDDRKSTVRVYPNPASNSTTVAYRFVDNIGGGIMLYSLEGKFLLKEVLPANENVVVINTSKFDNGIYFYSVYSKTGELVENGKLIILR